EPADVRRAVRGTDAVIHLAAKVSISGPEHEYRAINIDGTRHVVEAMAGQGGGDLVNVSSPSVAHLGRAIVGLDATPADPERARGPYARTKAAAELLAMAADGHEGMAVTSVRPHVVWGPGDTQLVGRIVARAAAGRLPLLDEGMALIDTTYVTNGEPRAVRDVFAGFCDAAGVPRPRLHVPGALGRLAGRVVEKVWEVRPGSDEPPMTEFLAEQLSTAHWFDQRRTRERLKWTPSVTMDEGFERLAAWYRENPFPG